MPSSSSAISRLRVRSLVVVLCGLVAAALMLAAVGLPTDARAQVSNPSVTAPSVQSQGKRITVKLRAGAAEAIGIVARGRVKAAGKSHDLRRVTASVAGGNTVPLVLRPKKRSGERKIRRAVKRGATPKARVTVKLSDLAGNLVKRVLKVILVD